MNSKYESVVDSCSKRQKVVDVGEGQGKQQQGNEQYFAAQPASTDLRHQLTVTLAGEPMKVEVSQGVFSSHRLDLGTSVLLRHAPEPEHPGTFLDLGCGWGPIALHLAKLSPQSTVWALDINERALDLTRQNARINGLSAVRAVNADQLPADLTFDQIWSNPPIRVGKEALHQLLMAYLPRLNTGGVAYLVVQRNLGSDSLIPWLQEHLPAGFEVSKYASSKGYRVIEVTRA
ncbi:16S RNA G1207 methylase RsmC [Bombiscardovia nodaiensis]|uniref:16S RNA G1207 methylase RsmC n=1 Tax=Bombiscardovia nodaiensis TaxID=2932181 RepID=A0ABN6SDK5_9BIFI|nr:16S RNA G1207 methylase RsmC [Bombiscardovia nodaiensis]